MLLSDIINDLRCGELAAHGIFASYPVMSDLNKEKLLLGINSGLLALYTRFPLLTKEIVIRELDNLTLYKLSSKYAYSNTASQEVKYIMDTKEDPFIDDVLRIDAIFDGDGEELILNNTTCCRVALTPSMDTIEIPTPFLGSCLSVVYRARHPLVKDDTTDIILPEHFRPALLAYIAHRIYSGSAGQDGMALSQAMYQKYELICSQYVDEGLVNRADGELYQQFNIGGWV